MTFLQSQIEESQAFFRQAFDDERLRSEHLEEQLNDMMELHQHEVTNIKQVSLSFLPFYVIFVFSSTAEDLLAQFLPAFICPSLATCFHWSGSIQIQFY